MKISTSNSSQFSTNAIRLSVAVVKLYAVACGMYGYMD